MIRYDYACGECGWTCEVRHSIRETPPVICERCGSSMTRRIAADAKVVTGRKSLAQQLASEKKVVEDIAHARNVANWVKEQGRPAARQSLAQALDARAAEREQTGKKNDDGLD